MSTLVLTGFFIVAIVWPSRQIGRLSPPTACARLCFYLLGPLTALAGDWCIAHFLFPLLAASPSSAQERESFLVNQTAVGLLAAAVLPWIAYFVLKAWRSKSRG